MIIIRIVIVKSNSNSNSDNNSCKKKPVIVILIIIVKNTNSIDNTFHHLRLPQISCSEGNSVQVASVFLEGVGGSGGAWGE